MIQGKTCKACPLGTYQDEKWQTECKRCGDKMTTSRKGATTVRDCFSTDSCHNGANNCTTHVNGGTCTLVGDGPDYTCGCREGWILDSDSSCTRPAKQPRTGGSLYVIGGGAGGLVLLLLGVILLVVCYCARRRTSPDSSAERQFPPAFQNQAYELSSEPHIQAVDEPEHAYETLSEATMDRRGCSGP
ncbi:hypothetical protein NP493_1280g00026 [Ridgeia piscesae]|uniref:EGF-like domain-containing protein n=1 Tax=Ridgeia piscesae TaxID=27915 RepID=A0AAD9K9N3_RIDPI|nr:hypothetical protein NP493_1280g00026 [Ridgeia piscesae]